MLVKVFDFESNAEFIHALGFAEQACNGFEKIALMNLCREGQKRRI